MRYLGEGAYARRISWLLVIMLLLPFVVFAGARPARAQLSRTPQVAVLEFGNRPNAPGGAILGRQATDSVVVEMTRTGRFDVTPRTQLNQQLQELGLTPPLDNIGIRKLGQALGVDFVATGDITRVVINGAPRRARVTLSVRLTDVASGELANGAIESGTSPEPPAGFQPDDDTLIGQALANAAFNAVQTISRYTLPEATILNTRDQSEVLLNRGSRDGITPGLEMIVVRGNETVGRIRVNSVGSTDATASVILNTKGIRPEDRARAVFSLPGYVNNTTTGETSVYDVAETTFKPRGEKRKSIVSSVLGLVAAVALAALLFRPSSNSNVAGGRVRARAFAEPADPTSGASSTRIEVRFDIANDIPQRNIQEIQIYRNSVTAPADPTLPNSPGSVPVGVLGPGERVFYDDPTTIRSVTFNRVLPDGSLEATTLPVGGFTPGRPQQYRIVVIYQRVQVTTGQQGGGGGGNQNGTQFTQTTFSGFSGFATPVVRPQVLGPSGELDMRNVSFTFQGSAGANQYVVEVADNVQFRNKKRPTSPTQNNPLTTATTGRITVGPFDLTKLGFVNTRGTTIYFRVGARNANDNPGPLPVDPNADAFIYSGTLNSFTAIGAPPPPPGGSTGTGTGNPPPPPTTGG